MISMQIQLRPHQQRGLDAMLKYLRGQLVMPTGAGKTPTMFVDCARQFESETPQTVVVVAPRILLAEQLSAEFLEYIKTAAVLHVHSGETHHQSTTKPAEIYNWSRRAYKHQLIFTTYNSLNRIQESGIDVDTIYFDEAHNSVRRDFYKEVAAASLTAKNAYYFTATPKYRGGQISMNNTTVYGKELINVPAPELVANGSIIPPTIKSHVVDIERNKSLLAAENDREVLIDIVSQLDEDSAQKILVAAPNTRVLLHQPLGGFGGTAADIQTQAFLINDMKKQLAAITAKQTGKTVEQIMADGDRDRWFNAQEALEYGFVDHIQEFAAVSTGVGKK